MPLPFVGHRYADSLVRGVAVILPVEVAAEGRHALLRVIARWKQESDCEVCLGSRRIRLARGDGLDVLGTLRRQTRCLQSTEWATVTPLALDRFPGDPRARDPQRQSAADGGARATIARACEHIGLPAPAEVLVRLDVAVSAVPPVRAFPVFRTPNGGPRRALVHAHLRFAEPIVGPPLLGAGRYVGQGLCLPLRASDPMAELPALAVSNFPAFFTALWGTGARDDPSPFPWQKQLVAQLAKERRWPDLVDLPTGTGKTSLLEIAIFLQALDAERPPQEDGCRDGSSSWWTGGWSSTRRTIAGVTSRCVSGPRPKVFCGRPLRVCGTCSQAPTPTRRW